MKRIMRRKTEMNADLNCMSHLQMCKKKIILIVCEKTCSWNFESDDAKKLPKMVFWINLHLNTLRAMCVLVSRDITKLLSYPIMILAYISNDCYKITFMQSKHVIASKKNQLLLQATFDILLKQIWSFQWKECNLQINPHSPTKRL